jgi:hypothetical protein
MLKLYLVNYLWFSYGFQLKNNQNETSNLSLFTILPFINGFFSGWSFSGFTAFNFAFFNQVCQKQFERPQADFFFGY